MRTISSFAALAFFLGFASPAFAKSPDRRLLEKAAKKACITGEFSKGVDILGDLFVETGDITYVFNQGRCFQQNHQWEPALDRFREYLRKKPGLPQDERNEVDKYIAECQSHLPKTEASSRAQTAFPAGAMPTAAPAFLESSSTPPTATPPARDPSAALATSPRTSRPGAGLRTAGIVVTAVGLAGIVTGVVMALKTQNIVDQMYSNGYSSSSAASRKSYETWGWVGYGAGAAGIVAGTTMYLLGRSAGGSDAKKPRWSFLPLVRSDGATLLLQGGIQ